MPQDAAEEHIAASSVQSTYHGVRANKNVGEMPAENAAVTIQAACRGFIARRHVSRIR